MVLSVLVILSVDQLFGIEAQVLDEPAVPAVRQVQLSTGDFARGRSACH
jgi:hypothetical protein